MQLKEDLIERINQVFVAAMCNPEFRKAVKEADNDETSWNAAFEQRRVVANTYYGWLVGKYGAKDWQKYL